MVEKIRQEIEVTGDQAATQAFDRVGVKGAQAFAKLNKSIAAANAALASISTGTAGAALDKTSRSANNAATAINKASVAANKLNFNVISTGAARARTALAALNAQLSRVGQSFSVLGPQARRLAGILATAFAVKEVAARADTYTNLQSKLKIVTKSEKERIAVEKQLYAIAKNTQGSYAGTISLFTRLRSSITETTASTKDLIQFTDTINKSLRISGGSAGEAKAALTQLAQAMASGRLQGDELRSILENFPVFAQQLAKGIGVTVGELRTLGKEGKLTANDILRAFQKQGKEIDKLFKNVQPTISTALGTLIDAFTRLLGTIDRLAGGSKSFTGFIDTIVASIDKLNEYLQTPAGKTQLESIINLFRGFVPVIQGVIAVFQGWIIIINAVTAGLNNLFNTSLTPFQVFLGIVTALIVAFAPLPVAIAAVVAIVGVLVTKIQEMGGIVVVVQTAWANLVSYVKQKASELWQFIVDRWNATIFGQIVNSIVGYFTDAFTSISNFIRSTFETVTGIIEAFIEKVKSAIAFAKQLVGIGDQAGGGGGGGSAPGFARGGGPLRGPGTARSDSILARLSRGEYIIKAAAVRRYGASLFAALNGMRLDPSAVLGSLSPAVAPAAVAVPRFAEGGAVSGRPLTLNIGGQSFGGLTASPAAVQQLERFAVKRSLASAGRKPTWHR